MQKNAVNWVEIPVDDFERAKTFYSHILDFDMPTEKMDNAIMGIFPFDQKEGIGCCIIKHENAKPNPYGTIVYLNGGSDLNTILSRVTDGGGKIIVPKTEINEGYGYYAMFQDTEGNTIGLHSR